MTDRSMFLGRLGGTTQIIFAVLLAGVAAFHFEAGFVPRSAVILGAFALLGIVGLIGTAARRPALLVAAGLSSAVGSFVAFSGVTLIFLIPAALLLAGALRLARPTGDGPGEGWISGLAALGLAAAIAVALLGAGASALLLTDEGCWTAYETPSGVRIELAPYTTGETVVPSGAVSTSCATGLISARGVGLGVLLGVTALGLAAVGARRHDRVPGRHAGAVLGG